MLPERMNRALVELISTVKDPDAWVGQIAETNDTTYYFAEQLLLYVLNLYAPLWMPYKTWMRLSDVEEVRDEQEQEALLSQLDGEIFLTRKMPEERRREILMRLARSDPDFMPAAKMLWDVLHCEWIPSFAADGDSATCVRAAQLKLAMRLEEQRFPDHSPSRWDPLLARLKDEAERGFKETMSLLHRLSEMTAKELAKPESAMVERD